MILLPSSSYNNKRNRPSTVQGRGSHRPFPKDTAAGRCSTREIRAILSVFCPSSVYPRQYSFQVCSLQSAGSIDSIIEESSAPRLMSGPSGTPARSPSGPGLDLNSVPCPSHTPNPNIIHIYPSLCAIQFIIFL